MPSHHFATRAIKRHAKGTSRQRVGTTYFAQLAMCGKIGNKTYAGFDYHVIIRVRLQLTPAVYTGPRGTRSPGVCTNGSSARWSICETEATSLASRNEIHVRSTKAHTERPNLRRNRPSHARPLASRAPIAIHAAHWTRSHNNFDASANRNVLLVASSSRPMAVAGFYKNVASRQTWVAASHGGCSSSLSPRSASSLVIFYPRKIGNHLRSCGSSHMSAARLIMWN